MALDSEVTKGQSATMKIRAFDDDGFEIKQARGRFFEVLLQTPSGEQLTKRSQFKDGLFLVLFDHDNLESVGTYSIWVASWNDGRSKTALKYEVPANTSEALMLPTKREERCQKYCRPHLLEVRSSQLKKILAGGLAVVIGAALGTAGMYARRNPGTTEPSAALSSNNAAAIVAHSIRVLLSSASLQPKSRSLLLWQARLAPF